MALIATRAEPLASPAGRSVLQECPGCGRFQLVPPLRHREQARCDRCGVLLRRAYRDPLTTGLALACTAMLLLVIIASATMMTVSTAGISHETDLFGGPVELVDRGLWILAIPVVFTTAVAPVVQLIGLIYVLLMLRTPQPPRHLAFVFKVTGWLAPWSMLEVFLLGAFVAYTKLQDLVQIQVGLALVMLMVFIVVMTWLNSVLDRHAMWEELQRRGVTGPPLDTPMPRLGPDTMGCHTCGLVQTPPAGGSRRCLRCDSPLHHRKPDSIARTWALCMAAAVMYIPANVFPVLTVVQLGSGAPSTILGGVRELVEAKMWPLAALVFGASVAVPVLKLLGLAFMMICVQIGAARWLRERTFLYGIVLAIGRWSMVDIFMESLLGALVRFGTLVTIEPGVGAVAFCAVVILTMIAAESFDPRLMWDIPGAQDVSGIRAQSVQSTAQPRVA